jgi:hypothetical protein
MLRVRKGRKVVNAGGSSKEYLDMKRKSMTHLTFLSFPMNSLVAPRVGVAPISFLG